MQTSILHMWDDVKYHMVFSIYSDRVEGTWSVYGKGQKKMNEVT